ncbi:unnamed protein product [Paramecium pentaurelia]|uniref:Uncharacterized protein n=1 Tax=Paramecium pentaurelia TaxID=43138 RepID=A0A8S1X197_9CILI|nr:unnamed protein product [Paramecium pentaurelia]
MIFFILLILLLAIIITLLFAILNKLKGSCVLSQPQSSNKKYKRIKSTHILIIQAIATQDKDKTQLVRLLINKSEQDILLNSELKAYATLKKTNSSLNFREYNQQFSPIISLQLKGLNFLDLSLKI